MAGITLATRGQRVLVRQFELVVVEGDDLGIVYHLAPELEAALAAAHP